MAFGGDEVVHHHRGGQVDVDAVHELAPGIDHVVAEIRLEEGVAEHQHLTGDGVEPGMGGHRTLQPTAEVVLTDGLQLGGHLGGEPAFPEGQPAVGVRDHVGVGRVLHRSGVTGDLPRWEVHHVTQPGVHGAAAFQLQRESTGADPAVAVGDPTVVEGDPVQHPVTVEHVIGPDRLEHRVGSIANEVPAQAFGDLAGHPALGDVQLVADREEVAQQVWLGLGVGDRSHHPIRRYIAHWEPPVTSPRPTGPR